MRVAAAGVLLAVVATGCVGPSRTVEDYKNKAANTAEAVASSVQTARFGAQAAHDKRITAAYLSRLVAEAEEDALAAQASFDSVQPPDHDADEVHDHLDELLTDALDLLRSARLAARRGHDDELAGLTEPLSKIGDKLDAFEQDPK
jgi:NTP pyrophosphatase (non-canonical NTP hydrolase)